MSSAAVPILRAVAHIRPVPGLDAGRSTTSYYLHAPASNAVRALVSGRVAAGRRRAGRAVGMQKFPVFDPSDNLLRTGCDS